MTKCKYANRIQREGRPMCNNGHGCDFCNKRYLEKMEAEAGRPGRILPVSGLFVADDQTPTEETPFLDTTVAAAEIITEIASDWPSSSSSDSSGFDFGGGGDAAGGGAGGDWS
jgi:hypothetical protein